MTAPMTMNRLIHAAVRRDLARLEGTLGRFPEGDRGRAQDLRRAYSHLQAELTRHHESEDRLIWPMLKGLGADAELLAAMESEHQALAAGLAETGAALDRLTSSASAADAADARASVVRTQAVVDQHLRHEETDLEPVMLSHEDTAEWKAVEKKLRSAPLGVAGRFFAWLQDGMTPEGRGFLDRTVPKPVTALMSRVVGRRYHREIAPVWKA